MKPNDNIYEQDTKQVVLIKNSSHFAFCNTVFAPWDISAYEIG